MDLSGLPVTFLDTAGIRETEDHIESIGIARARQRAEQADIRVFLKENDLLADIDLVSGDIVVNAKGDLLDGVSDGISGLTGLGVQELLSAITQTLLDRSASIGIATRLRHANGMQRASEALASAERLIPQGEECLDIAAEETRTAIRALDFLVGRIDVEHILDEIFASFCLGK
jgi:tRNA modification GTPase